MIRTSKDILQKEVDKVMDEIIQLYESSGKKTSGQFEEGLETKVSENRIEIWGYSYLAGRPAGKMPPVQAIEKWVIAKGIASMGLQSSGLAWAIAKKIAAEGTADESHLPIYERILTPQRMDEIIKKVEEFHVQQIVEEITTRIMSISQKYQK